MTTRSIVLGTAALLLFSTTAPVQFGFAPVAAIAQEISAEVRAALAADPAQLEARQISEHVRVLRDAIQSGAFTGADKKAAQEKMRAMREVLKQLRAGRQDTAQDNGESEQAQPPAQQAEQAQPAESVEAEQPASKADQQAEKAARRAAKQAEKAQREAEKAARQAAQQAQTQQQPAQPQQQQAQTQQQPPAAPAPAVSQELNAVLQDNRPAEELDPDQLRDRIQTMRRAVESGGLSREQRGEVQARIKADRDALRSRRDASKTEQTAAPTPEAQPPAVVDDTPKAEVVERAQAIISDNRPADALDDNALRKRLTDNRAILETGKLSNSEVRELRRQLREDREELRSRVAKQQEKEEVAEKKPDAKPDSAINTRDVELIIEQRIASDRLTDRELEERVRVLSRALKQGNITLRQSEVAKLLIEQDRRELSRRLYAERDRRRERRQSRNDVFIEFDVGYRPPQVIFAAEAMPRQIEMQLVAPPVRQISRPYSVQEIASNQDVREMMPGIEIDTLNFDFGSAEVRPEEIDKLDAIAEVIERIVAARPDEVFLIEGHTDAVGSDQANAVLSQRRANAVVEALLDYYAIDPENLQTVGLGERFLKVWTEEPEEENRRVTVRRITPLLAGGQG